ncbi:STAS domain-containing protein [Nocardiopsis coralliicola]
MRRVERHPVRREGGVPSIALPSTVDADSRTSILEQCLGLLCARPRRLVVDMSGTVSCDAVGVDLLVRLQRRARLLGCDLHVVIGHPRVRELFSAARLHRLVTVHDRAAAPAAVRVPGQAAASRAAVPLRP